MGGAGVVATAAGVVEGFRVPEDTGVHIFAEVASAPSGGAGGGFFIREDTEVVQQASTAGRVRGVARLIADLSEFMTLHPGDIVLTGISHQAPLARIGQTVTVTFAGIGRIENTLDEFTKELQEARL